MSSHDSRGPYSSRQGMDYGGGLIQNFVLLLNREHYFIEIHLLPYMAIIP